jgi:Zn-dependent protease/CBS domain-containing protein
MDRREDVMQTRSQAVNLGKVLGVPIQLDYSWFLIFILFTWLLAASYFPVANPGWPVWEYWVLGAITSFMLFVSVLLHELGHSAVAIRNGIPVRSITLFIFGGVSQITKEPTRAITDFVVAASGLGVSLVLAIFFFLLQPVVASAPPVLALVQYLTYINAVLLIFNLIPGYPLDGGRVFRSIVWGISKNYDRSTYIAATLGRIISFGFILLGVWLIFFGSFVNGLWIIFIGWFLENASAREAQQLSLHSMLTGRQVKQAMSRNFVTIPGDISLQQLTDDHILGQGRRFFIIQNGGGITGIMTLHKLREVPRTDWPATSVSKVMIPIDQMDHVSPDSELWDALQKMDEEGVNQLPVMEDGELRGVLTRENVISFLQTLRELT